MGWGELFWIISSQIGKIEKNKQIYLFYIYITSRELTYPFQKVGYVFQKVGYVSSLEGICTHIYIYIYMLAPPPRAYFLR